MFSKFIMFMGVARQVRECYRISLAISAFAERNSSFLLSLARRLGLHSGWSFLKGGEIFVHQVATLAREDVGLVGFSTSCRSGMKLVANTVVPLLP